MDSEEVEKLKQLVCKTIDDNSEMIISFSKSVEKEPYRWGTDPLTFFVRGSVPHLEAIAKCMFQVVL